MPEKVSSMHEDAYYTRYLMLHHSNSFSADPRLYFFLFNIMQRHANLRGTSLKIKAQETNVQAFAKITRSDTFMERLEGAIQDPKSPDAARLIASIQPHITTAGRHAAWSPAARRSAFNHLQASCNRFGLGPGVSHDGIHRHG